MILREGSSVELKLQHLFVFLHQVHRFKICALVEFRQFIQPYCYLNRNKQVHKEDP